MEELSNRYFMCDKFKCELKVQRCMEMRKGDKRRKECWGCKQHESLTLENTHTGDDLEQAAMAQIIAEPERKIKDLRHIGYSLAYNSRNRVSKR